MCGHTRYKHIRNYTTAYIYIYIYICVVYVNTYYRHIQHIQQHLALYEIHITQYNNTQLLLYRHIQHYIKHMTTCGITTFKTMQTHTNMLYFCKTTIMSMVRNI